MTTEKQIRQMKYIQFAADFDNLKNDDRHGCGMVSMWEIYQNEELLDCLDQYHAVHNYYTTLHKILEVEA